MREGIREGLIRWFREVPFNTRPSVKGLLSHEGGLRIAGLTGQPGWNRPPYVGYCDPGNLYVGYCMWDRCRRFWIRALCKECDAERLDPLLNRPPSLGLIGLCF